MTTVLKNTLLKNTVIRSWSPVVDVPGSTLIIDPANPYSMNYDQVNIISVVNNEAEIKNVININQPTNEYRPTYDPTGLNGKGIIKYNGNTWLQNLTVKGSDIFSANQVSIFIVRKHNLLHNGRDFYWRDPGNAKSVNINDPWGNGDIYFDAPYPSGRISQAGHGGKLGWSIFAFVKESDTLSRVYYNGNLLFSGTYASTSISMTDTFPLFIGDSGNRFNGDIADLLVWPRVLTANEFNSVIRFLKNKRGL